MSDRTADVPDLVDRLVAHTTLGAAPREELEWLARQGELRAYPVGAIMTSALDPIDHMQVILSGHVVQYLMRATHGERRKIMVWSAGDVTGLLPYSRMTRSPGESVAEAPTDALLVHRDRFGELVRECPGLTTALVHTMLDRAHVWASAHFEDEKMMSLGRLAAGLAHELNNPASAAARTASMLVESIADLRLASRAIAKARFADAELDVVERFSATLAADPTALSWTPLERADREEALSVWLDAHGTDPSVAAALADAGVTQAAADELAGSVSADALDAALGWIAAESNARTLSFELKRSATRIHELVSAMTRFTYMDRAPALEPADIARGLQDAATLFAAKARSKSITVGLDLASDLPEVLGYGGQLNQVWTNLIDNAIDAAPASGQVSISVVAEGGHVVVRVIDDGPGIPPAIRGRIFQPFFTTKPPGQGAGLGLDIAWRIVHRHEGTLELDAPEAGGRTEFRVRLPVSPQAPRST